MKSDEEKSIADQLREPAKPKEEGINTKQEFNEKEKVLLDKII